MNLSSYRLWCYECKTEVFLEHAAAPSSYCNESDQDGEPCPFRSRDSGHGSYSTLRTNTPEHSTALGFERVTATTSGMAGDSSDSSDGEEGPEYGLDKPQGLVGLQNIGNTCYMNAALQALSNTLPLTKFFLECITAVQILSEGRKPGLSRTYQALMRDIWVKKNGGYVTPSGILYGIRSVHPMFRGYHQHDTQEFLRNFMDQLHEELKQMQPPEQLAQAADADTFSMAMDEPTISSSYDSSEGEYETCDSGVSERSSLSDDTERPTNSTSKRRLSRSASPGRRLRARLQSTGVVDSQPSTSTQGGSSASKRQVKYRSIISDIFDGKLLSSVQCLTCDRISSRVETFQDLSLPIPSRDHLVVLHGRSTASATCSEAVIPMEDGWITWILAWLRSWFYGPTVTLHDCLAAFFSTDELKGDNMYSCEKCNKLRNGIKFSKVLQLPEILCIHLKRFRHELMFSSKISSVVSFPLKGLEMKPYLHSDCVSKVTTYELFSVICHHGTAGGGHYICYALNGNQWYEFDDQYVTRVPAEKVQSCEAYVLFYRKINTTADEVRNEVVKLAGQSMDDAQEMAYISKQWLSRFSTCAEPGPIDNSDFLCQHGSVNPDREAVLDQLTVMIPVAVYEFMQKKFGGCAPMVTAHICPACQALQKRVALERETFLQLTREVQELNLPMTHMLSTSWYGLWHNFIQRRTAEPPGPIDNSKINLNQIDLNECAEVSETVWNFFHNIYGGGPELKVKPNIQRAESEVSIASETAEEAPEFVIPTLRKKQDKVDTIDSTMYSHGEPMDTEPSPPPPPAAVRENGVVDSDKESTVDDVNNKESFEKDTTDVTCNDSLSNNSFNSPRSAKVETNNRHRKRRQAVDFSSKK